jgi:hypothetical protein
VSRRAAVSALVAALAARGGADGGGADGGGAAEVVERDSAGVRIVEIPAGASGAAPEWTLGADPAGTLGSEQGADLFRVSGALRMADGGIVVVNGGSAELVLYDPRDGSVRRFGRVSPRAPTGRCGSPRPPRTPAPPPRGRCSAPTDGWSAAS